MSRSRITIDDEPVSTDPGDWLHNPHAGEMLVSEFMKPLSLSTADLAALIDIPESRIVSVVNGDCRMDAELDLRLARYFRMSEGFFLRLQDSYELLEQRRALGSKLDRIIPRAA